MFSQYLNDNDATKKEIWDYVVNNLYCLLACIVIDDTFNKDKTDEIKYYGFVKTAFDTAIANLAIDTSFRRRILVHFGKKFPSQLLEYVDK